MADERPSSSLKDVLVTFLTIYVCLTFAGMLAAMAPGWVLARPMAVLVFIGLLALHAFTAGRRTRAWVYALTGLLCPLVVTVFGIVALSLVSSPEVYRLVETLLSGFGVGFEVGDSRQAPLLLSFLLWWLGIALAVITVVAIRGIAGRHARQP